eukprot:TRINITY_DN3301_c0_g1_i3.p1 TRINITY_DN3301_c0_g1~~TRINITY_DN3301_c0_g1_i3.p1  ORF type:complete len:100 (-),score=19.76 TRINITY_DN3301_c0_g1_i3:499-798(-)
MGHCQATHYRHIDSCCFFVFFSVTRLHPVIDHKTKRRTLTFNKSKSNVQSSDDGSGYLYPKLSPPEKDRSKPTTTTTTTTTTTHSLRSDGSSMPSKSFC